LLAESTKKAADAFYSLRCLNTYKAEKALIERIQFRDDTTEEQIIGYLKGKYKCTQIALWETGHISMEHESDVPWLKEKKLKWLG
jgi:hypothetical protein